jgi:peptidoglycan/xylan/chitin deacetylase (PgdA/CDA1 family)
MIKKPFISIVVPAYNEEDMIADCLLSLRQQNYDGGYEIIVVNNASTDSTSDIAASMGAKVVNEWKKGYVHALRAGFSEASGDIIACTDADTRVSSTWLSQITELLEKPGTIACSGTFRFYDGPAWLRFIGEVFGRFNYHLAGANMAVWRTDYLASGGFNTNVNMGADVELGQRLKKQGILVIDKKLRVDTSGRRFQCAFLQTLWLYYLNDLWLLLFKRPLFYNFPNIRIPQANHAPSMRSSVWARLAIFTGVIGCFLWITENTNNQFFGTVFAHGGLREPLVALTFDDGPSRYTPRILDILDKYNVKATFFAIGKNVERYPDIARRIVSEGHVIGNHTYSHPFWAPMETPGRIKSEVDQAEAAIQKTTGVSTNLFRPPHGWRSPWMAQMLKKYNYSVVTWTVSPDDWSGIGSDVVSKRVLAKTHSGAIILLHDGLETKDNFQKDNTIQALPAIISELKIRGYRFVTVPQLIEASPEFVPRNVTLFHSSFIAPQN